MPKKLIIFITVIIIILLSFAVYKINRLYQKVYSPKQTETKKNKDTISLLLLGYGGGTHEGTYLTDSMMIFQVNIKTKKALILSVPRDLWVKLPTESGDAFYSKINAVYTIGLAKKDFYPDLKESYRGDGKLLKFVLESVTGIEIDNYLAVDFTGFVKAVDAIGGVTINIDKPFVDERYPIEGKEAELCGKDSQFKEIAPFLQPGYNPTDRDNLLKNNAELLTLLTNATDSPELAFPCRYERLEFKKGRQFMNGKTALKFVRSRYSQENGGDFNRAHRQQLFVTAIKQKLLSLNSITKFFPLLESLSDHVATDLAISEIQKILKTIGDLRSYEVKNTILSEDNYLINGMSDDGQYILIPKEGIDQWKNLKLEISNYINDITPAPTTTSSESLKR